MLLLRDDGDIFLSEVDAILNPVNAVGVAGGGLALAFAKRFPIMNQAYVEACNNGNCQIGKVFVWDQSQPNIVCFPTKDHWRFPSKMEYVSKGLESLEKEIYNRGWRKLAVPALGAGLGGLPWMGQDGVLALLIAWSENHPDLELEVFSPRG